MPRHPPILWRVTRTRRLSGTTAAPIWKKTRRAMPRSWGLACSARRCWCLRTTRSRTPLQSRFRHAGAGGAHTAEEAPPVLQPRRPRWGWPIHGAVLLPHVLPGQRADAVGKKYLEMDASYNFVGFSPRAWATAPTCCALATSSVPHAEQPVGREPDNVRKLTDHAQFTAPTARRTPWLRTFTPTPRARHGSDAPLARRRKAALLRIS